MRRCADAAQCVTAYSATHNYIDDAMEGGFNTPPGTDAISTTNLLIFVVYHPSYRVGLQLCFSMTLVYKIEK